jgi:uncharacterized protein YjiS (DUF1127 family)
MCLDKPEGDLEMLMRPLSTPQYHSNPAGRHGWLWTIATWYMRARQRQALRLLDSRLLDDIGVSEDERRQELAKPFWR